MDLLHTIVLAIIQGLTEFLPISSSAHLILVPLLTGWPDQGLAFDVAVHLGTLLAVLLYFRHEIEPITRDWVASLSQRRVVGDSTLAWGIALATLPAALAGLLFKDLIELHLRSALVIASTTLIFGLVLWLADAGKQSRRDEYQLGWPDFLVIGAAQALALIPGTSRSGITITAGLMLGLNATAAARFSFLLSIPIIALAGGYNALGLVLSQESVDWASLLVGTTVSALSAYFCIHYFLQLLDKVGMLPFVAYRLVLGIVLLVMFW
jgi:undecaprenyl-diphosphatase